MSLEDFLKISSILKAAYPSPNFLPNEYAVKLWHNLLKDLGSERLMTAATGYILTNKYPPTIADLRGLAAEQAEPNTLEWSDAWGQVKAAIRRFGMYREQEALDSMDETTATAVRRLGWKSLCTSGSAEATDRAQFRQIFEQVAARKRQANVMPQEYFLRLAGVRQAMIEQR